VYVGRFCYNSICPKGKAGVIVLTITEYRVAVNSIVATGIDMYIFPVGDTEILRKM
jgi:hypothetical protein